MFFRKILTWILVVGFLSFVFLLFFTPVFPVLSWALPLTTGDGAYIIFFVIVLLISFLSIAQSIDYRYDIKQPKVWDGTEVPDSARPVFFKILSVVFWYKISVSALFILIAIVGLFIVITR